MKSFTIERKPMPTDHYLDVAYRVRINSGRGFYHIKDDKNRTAVYGSFSAAEAAAEREVLVSSKPDPAYSEHGWEKA